MKPQPQAGDKIEACLAFADDLATKEPNIPSVILSAEVRRQQALLKIAADALECLTSMVDLEHIDAVFERKVNLSGDAVRDIRIAYIEAKDALAQIRGAGRNE